MKEYMREKSVKKRNGKIELYRFIFAIFVLLFHFEKYFIGPAPLDKGIHLAFFRHGSIGVEFFFLLSGFFMARSVEKAIKNSGEEKLEPVECIQFMWKKYTSVFPYHVVAFIFSFITYAMVEQFNWKESILKLIDSVPNFFLIQMSGISFTNPNHVEWYISCMFLAMCVLYPIARKYYKMLYQYVGPVFSLFVIGYMIYTTHALTGVQVWTGFWFKSTLRAVVEIILGGTCYEISKVIRSSEAFENGRYHISFIMAELVSFAGVTVFVISTVAAKYEVYALVLLMVLVTIAGSDKGISHEILNSRFCLFLGKLSLPIYLSQVSVIWFAMRKQWNGMSNLPKFLLLECIMTFVVLAGGEVLKKICSRKNKDLKSI